MALQRHAVRHVEDARHVLGALDVAHHPVEIVGGAAQHQSSPARMSEISSSSTQVSLVPPPWLELTTSEPSRSATRVSPPGTTRMVRSEEHTSELQSLMRISYAVFCLKKKNQETSDPRLNTRQYGH